ncbi:MerR family DNA-binding transcriptional regulator [Streptomyces venezuelae]|uniref:MerR family DNA-binding transcriptional regulator n=1 Tax=Streptomyces venezuelae TaxID=54571 RepID=UPI003455D7E3
MTQMRISELAARSGIPATTLRFYEDTGLLTPDRGPSCYRPGCTTKMPTQPAPPGRPPTPPGSARPAVGTTMLTALPGPT